MPNLWEHDVWADIYDIPDPVTRNVVVQIYRLILDMRESDILAEKIAAAINKERNVAFTLVQKIIAAVVSLIVAADTTVHLYQVFGGK